MGEKDPWFDRMRARFRLEHGLLLGGVVAARRARRSRLVIVVTWVDRGFGELSEERLAVLAATLVIVGLQIFFTSFLLSHPRPPPPRLTPPARQRSPLAPHAGRATARHGDRRPAARCAARSAFGLGVAVLAARSSCC